MPTLFDQFGRAIPLGSVKKPDSREIAVAQIRDRWSDYPSRGLTPSNLAAILEEADTGDMEAQCELFEEMEEKDAHLSSQFHIRKLAAIGLPYEIEPQSEDAADQKIVDFCREAIEAMPDFEDVMLDILDAIPKGYSLSEILWDVSSTGVFVRDIRWIHPKKVTFWNSFVPRLLTDETPIEGTELAPFKFVYHRHKTRSGYDTRAGIMRVCAWMYLFKNYAIKDWVAFAEVYGMPLRLGRFDQGASQQDKDALLLAIQSLGSDAAGIISKATEIEFVEAQRTTTLDIYDSLVTFCDAQMSKAVLGQVLTSDASGAKGSGSFALGKVHSDVRQDLLESDAKALSKTITNQLLRPLVGFNFGWDAPVPQFRLVCEPPEDLKSVAEVYKIMAELGLRMSQEHVSERFNIPLAAKDEEPLNPKPEPAVPTPGSGLVLPQAPGGNARPDPTKARALVGAAHPTRPSSFVLHPSFDPGQQTIEDLVEEVDPQVNPLTLPAGRIFAIVQKAESYGDMLEAIYASFGNLDSTAFEEVLRQAMFAADLWGYMKAKQNDKP